MRTALKLMEMQRQTQLMYTSCGWFFTELSGLETVQIMRYAARAIQLAEALSPGLGLESRFVARLKQARSNIPEYHDGEWIYNHFVKPSVVDFEKVVNHYAICTLFNTFEREEDDTSEQPIYIYRVSDLEREQVGAGEDSTRALIGRVGVRSTITLEQAEFAYILLQNDHDEKLRCYVRELKNGLWDFQSAAERIRALMGSPQILDEQIKKIWGGREFSLADMFYDERRQVAEKLIQDQVQDLSTNYQEMFEKYKRQNLTLAQLDIPLPQAIITPAKITLSRILYDEFSRLDSVSDVREFRRAMEASRLARRLKIELNDENVLTRFQKKLEKHLFRLYLSFTPENARRVVTLIELADHLKLKLAQSRIQNLLFEILKLRVLPAIETIVEEEADKSMYDVVNDTLRIAYRFNFNIKVYKDRLRAFEEKISQDPNYWP